MFFANFAVKGSAFPSPRYRSYVILGAPDIDARDCNHAKAQTAENLEAVEANRAELEKSLLKLPV